MKRFIVEEISCPLLKNYCHFTKWQAKDGISSDLALPDEWYYDYSTEMLVTFDEKEAYELFNTLTSDCEFEYDGLGYYLKPHLYQLRIEEGEMIDGNFEMEDIENELAPFYKDVYYLD